MFLYRVLEQHKMTPEEWEERITNWWVEHKSMLRYVCTCPLCVTVARKGRACVPTPTLNFVLENVIVCSGDDWVIIAVYLVFPPIVG